MQTYQNIKDIIENVKKDHYISVYICVWYNCCLTGNLKHKTKIYIKTHEQWRPPILPVHPF
jgi:hypothetical protein